MVGTGPAGPRKIKNKPNLSFLAYRAKPNFYFWFDAARNFSGFQKFEFRAFFSFGHPHLKNLFVRPPGVGTERKTVGPIQ